MFSLPHSVEAAAGVLGAHLVENKRSSTLEAAVSIQPGACIGAAPLLSVHGMPFLPQPAVNIPADFTTFTFRDLLHSAGASARASGAMPPAAGLPLPRQCAAAARDQHQPCYRAKLSPPLQPAAPSAIISPPPWEPPPCSTLYLANLGDAVDEAELRGVCSTAHPCLRHLKVTRPRRGASFGLHFTAR